MLLFAWSSEIPAPGVTLGSPRPSLGLPFQLPASGCQLLPPWIVLRKGDHAVIAGFCPRRCDHLCVQNFVPESGHRPWPLYVPGSLSLSDSDPVPLSVSVSPLARLWLGHRCHLCSGLSLPLCLGVCTCLRLPTWGTPTVSEPRGCPVSLQSKS